MTQPEKSDIPRTPPAGWTRREVWLPPDVNIHIDLNVLEKLGQAPVVVVKLPIDEDA